MSKVSKDQLSAQSPKTVLVWYKYNTSHKTYYSWKEGSVTLCTTNWTHNDRNNKQFLRDVIHAVFPPNVKDTNQLRERLTSIIDTDTIQTKYSFDIVSVVEVDGDYSPVMSLQSLTGQTKQSATKIVQSQLSKHLHQAQQDMDMGHTIFQEGDVTVYNQPHSNGKLTVVRMFVNTSDDMTRKQEVAVLASMVSFVAQAVKGYMSDKVNDSPIYRLLQQAITKLRQYEQER